ncbi:MAG: hypothetical protein J1E95_02135 [Muribaculaceae bacterium]|nr:hypothetical protein [Muribaculaceae bacterium]
MFIREFIFLALSLLPVSLSAATPKVAFDMDEARDICDNLPLENIEGIWIYPDDKVTVLILNDGDGLSSHSIPNYRISVVESSDTRLNPGETIGFLKASPESKTYSIELATERKNELLLKPKSCLATLSADGDSFIIKKQKSGLKGRLNLNLNRLLPGFWKIVSLGVSGNGMANRLEAPAGMIKIYPSYDGNGSSRRKPRYL